jgi:hypothetical protein
MGRSAVACRNRFGADDRDESLGRLEEQNAGLREQLAEVEGWYRLLQADHAALQAQHGRCGREAIGLRAERNRLEVENKELQDIVSRLGAAAPADGAQREDESVMTRILSVVRGARRHKWAVAALVTILTLVARDSWVQGVASSAAARVRDLASRGEDKARQWADSGFLRYAAMVNARDALERARAEYNRREADLKGDALLEAQDRLRAAKARYRQARLAFLPELARRCEASAVPVPPEAADALAALKAEAQD